MKQYEVEIKERYSHGCYGKQTYFGLVLSADSCKNAETFAEDIIYDMTYQEFFDRCISDNYRKSIVQTQFMNVQIWTRDESGRYIIPTYYKRELTDKIKNDRKFTFKARVFKG
jgi:hypothetical protein